MKQSLRFKVFKNSIIPGAVAVIVFMIVGIFQVRRFGNLMEQTNEDQNHVILDTVSDSMKEMATEEFQKYVVSQTNVLNRKFWSTRHDLEVLARQVEMVLSHPESYGGVSVAPPSASDAGRLTLQVLYSETADGLNPQLKHQIRLVGGLRSMMMEIVEANDSLIDCVVALKCGASILADREPEKKIRPDGSAMSFNAERRPWYVGALVHEGTYFTPVNEDAFTGDLQIMAGVPVYVDGTLEAVCGGSVRLEEMGKFVSEAQLGDYTDSCLINENGNVMYTSRTEGELGLENNNLKSLKESSNAQLVSLVNEALKGDVGFAKIELDQEATYIAYAPIETVGWTQLLMIPQEDLNRTAYVLMQKTDQVMEGSLDEVRSNESRTILKTLIIGATLLLLALLTSMLLANSLVRPIKHMTRKVSMIQGDNMSFQVDDTLLTGDEIEILARSFENMSEQMQGYVHEIVQITSEKQRLKTELSVASQIQEHMLPTKFPAFPDRKEFDLYAVMDPAREVGGDFYDYFLIDDDHLAVVMADVSGKGVPAALFMVISRTLIKNVTLSGVYDRPSEILRDVNNKLCEGNEDNMFVTAWLGILTISTGSLISSCAGHEYPVFYRKSEGFVIEKDPHGLAMGGMEGVRYKDARWKLHPGDLLFLYTDGVPEANNSAQELFGNDRMLSALENSRNTITEDREPGETGLYEFLHAVRKQIDDFVGDTPQFDDLTMLCMKYTGPEHGPENGI